MGTEVAVRRGVGTVVLDVRRGDGPAGCFNDTMASIAATDVLIARAPDAAAGAVRAIVRTQKALRAFAEAQQLPGVAPAFDCKGRLGASRLPSLRSGASRS